MQDPPDGNIWLQILLLFILILINAFFAASEIAIISLNDNKIRRMAEEGNKKAKQVMNLTSDSSRFLATIQIGVTLAGFLTSAAAASSLAGPLANWFITVTDISASFYGAVNTTSVILVTIIISYFSLVLGELVPKRVAMQKAEKIAFAVVGVLGAIDKVMLPFVTFLTFSTNVVVRLFGMDPNAGEENVTEEEIRMMVDVGGEKGVIEDVQKIMIDNIFEFDDITAEDIMTPRTDVETLEVDAGLEEALRIGVDKGYSRLPVYEDEIDNIVGILYVKDLLPYVGQELPENVTIHHVMRKAHYVPETKKAGTLFSEMSEKHIHLSVIVDEYGGFEGIVTLEDLLESIVGNIEDEYDQEKEYFIQINETEYEVEGSIDVEKLGEILGFTFPEGDYDTVAGYIIDVIGRIPDGEEKPIVTISPKTAKVDTVVFTVMEMDERRIARIHIKVTPPVISPPTKTKDEKDEDNDKSNKNSKEDKEKDNTDKDDEEVDRGREVLPEPTSIEWN